MQLQKIRMNKRKFRIGELAKKLKVKKFVIRFWEKEFELESSRSDGGQRFYSQEDLNTFVTIKDLLYNQKFTIPGAKKQLKLGMSTQEETENNEINPAIRTTNLDFKPEPIADVEKNVDSEHFLNELQMLKQKLIALKNILN